jgi:hypothetical protein
VERGVEPLQIRIEGSRLRRWGPKLGVECGGVPEVVKLRIDVHDKDLSRGCAALWTAAATSSSPGIEVAAMLQLVDGQAGPSKSIRQQALEGRSSHCGKALHCIIEEIGYLDSGVEEGSKTTTIAVLGSKVG